MWPLGFKRVTGHSMAPHLLDGHVVIVSRWFTRPKVGEVVIIRHNGLEKIKRITDVKDGRVFVSGDNRWQSTDSHDFGWLGQEAIIAKLLWPRV